MRETVVTIFLRSIFRFGFDQQDSVLLDQRLSQSSSTVKLFGSKR